jgi:predicted dehydrogenase
LGRKDRLGDAESRWTEDLVTRTLRVGVIGCGNVTTQFHLPAYRSAGDLVEVAGLADVEPARIAEAQAVCPVADEDTTLDFRQLLARPDIDVVDIATPPALHADIARAAAAAGKHVLCEKPITTVPRDAAAMLTACRAQGVTVGVMHNWAFYPEVLAARAIVDAGEIGEVRLAIVNYLGIPDIKGAGETVKTWRHDPASAGGGVLIDMLHCLYITELMMGRTARRVSGWVSGNPDHPAVEATALCRLETDGPVALVNVGWGIGPGGIFIEGTRGSIEMRWADGGTGPFVALDSMEVRGVDGGRRQVDVPKLALPEIHVRGMAGVIRDFAEAIAQGRQPAISGEDGLHALEVTLAVYASAAQARTVEVPLGAGDPVYERGVAAIPDLAGPAWTNVSTQRLYRSPTGA